MLCNLHVRISLPFCIMHRGLCSACHFILAVYALLNLLNLIFGTLLSVRVYT